MVDAVFSELDYDPDVPEHTADVISRLNDVYEEVNDDDDWPWLVKESDLSLYATVEGASGVTVAITAPNLRQVTGVGTSFGSHYEGQTFTAPDGNEYTVAYVASTTEMYLTASATASAASTSWSVKFKRYVLPADCVDVTEFVSRSDDRGPLVFIDRRKEGMLDLDEDYTGTSEVVIEDDYVDDATPWVAIGLNATTGGTDIASSTKYAYCYTFLYEGRESAPSSVAEVTTGASDNRVELTLPDTSWRDSTPTALESGRRKRVYRRDVTNNGPWMLVATMDASDTSHNDDRLIPTTVESYENATHLDPTVITPSVRLWYTAGADRTIRILYKRRPRRLAKNTDIPIFPRQYHRLLVWGVLTDLTVKTNPQEAQHWAGRFNDKFSQMQGRYIKSGARRIVRGRWDRPIRSRFGDIYGEASIT